MKASGSSVGSFPLLLEVGGKEMDIREWLMSRKDELDRSLSIYGAIVIRGFPVLASRDLSDIAKILFDVPMRYIECSSPRSEFHPGIYSSTDYRSDMTIPLHNENSYGSVWPRKMFFYCLVPPETGGETTLGDCRRILQRIAPEVVGVFEKRKIKYRRHVGEGMGLTWQQIFQTGNREEMVAYCQQAGYGILELEGGRMRIDRVGEAVRTHPGTGERVWFNHGAFFNVQTLPPELREAMEEIYRPDEYPIHTLYGDGAPIPATQIEHIAGAYREECIPHRWQAGDLLLLDNMLCAHGRAPFTGERRILVTMCDPLFTEVGG